MQLKHPPALHRHVMDAANLSFDDSSFDLVFSIFVFEHVAKPEETLLEIKRVLKPGAWPFIVLILLMRSMAGMIYASITALLMRLALGRN